MKAQIPSTAGVDPTLKRILDPMKENIEQLRGRRQTKIEPLSASATNSEIIAKINEVIERMQG